MNLMKPEEDTQESLVQDFSLQVLGVLVNSAIGDPTGMSAAVIPRIVREVLHRIITPLTSKSESKRLYQWAKQAAEGIAQRSKEGEEFRKDEFLEGIPTNSSNWEEVIESTLKKVMDTTEEPKIKFMANLTENFHFDSDFNLDMYRRILKILDELSYRQLCIIKLFMKADQIDLDTLGNPNVTPNLSSILTDCFEVSDKGFINSGNPLMKKIRELYLGSSGSFWSGGGSGPEYPGFPNRWANVLSENMFKFAKLDQIPDEHVDSILKELRSGSTDAS